MGYYTTSVPYHRLVFRDGQLVAVRYAKPEHLLRKPLAWSYHVEIIEAMQKAGVSIMEVVYGEKVFSCPLQRFLKYAVRHNRGRGDQLFLPLQYWDTARKEEGEESERRPEHVGQLPLLV